jgi:peptidoglycan hydrolase-like protein with peptidoglycan-binding domain
MMNPLKLAIITVAGISGLAALPSFLSNLTSKSSQSIPETGSVTTQTPTLEMAELPAPTARGTQTLTARKIEAVLPAEEKKLKSPEKKVASVSVKSPPSLSASQRLTQELRSENTKSLPVPEPAIRLATEIAQATPAPTPTPTPKPEIPYRKEVEDAQRALEVLELSAGRIDGKLGPKTVTAIKTFQKQLSMAETGEPDGTTLKKLTELARAAETRAAKKAEEQRLAAEAAVKSAEEELSKKPGTKADDPELVLVRKDEEAQKDEEVQVEEIIIPDAGAVPTLKRVSDVKKLQEKLAAAGIYKDNVDGKWGDDTIAAMRAYQEKYELKVTGKPNQETWNRMNWVERRSSKSAASRPTQDEEAGEQEDKILVDIPREKPVVYADSGAVPTLQMVSDVKKLQERLACAGMYADTIDGKWGDDTRAAMRVFQEKHGLEVTGKPNKETWQKLNDPKTGAVVEKRSAKQVTKTSSSKVEMADAKGKFTRNEIPASREPVTIDLTAGRSEKTVPADEGVESKLSAGVERDLKVSGPESPQAVSARIAEEQAAVPAAIEAPKSARRVQEKEVFVKVNADAGAMKPEAIATPAIPQSALDDSGDNIAASNAQDGQEEAKQVASLPKISVRAPSRASSSSPAAAKGSAQLVSKSKSSLDQKEDVVETDNEVVLLPPASKRVMSSVTESLPAKAAEDTSVAEKPVALSASLAVSDPPVDSREKAEQKVQEVERIYNEVKDRFADEVRKGSLADVMAKIDSGYTAMKGDFKKGNYDPIIERCDGFKLQIEIIGNKAARNYLEAELGKKAMKQKLRGDDHKKIESLRHDEKYMEAARLLEELTKDSGAQKPKG